MQKEEVSKTSSFSSSEETNSMSKNVEINLSSKTSLFSSGSITTAQVDWFASKENFVKSAGISNCRPKATGPLGEWPKQKPIQIENYKLPEVITQVSESSSTTTANSEIDGFIKLSEDIKLKTENMKLKMEVAKLQREKNIEVNRATKLQTLAAKDSKQQKKREEELWKSLDKMTKSRDNARKANNTNRAKVSILKKKVKRLESTSYTDGLKKKGAKEVLEKATFASGQVKSILNPGKRVHYSKQDVVQALVQKALGTKSFNHLRRTAAYRIPSRQTQERWLGNLMSSLPGFQDDAILACKELMKNSTKEYFKSAMIVFDEMYLSKKMELHRKTQTILGPYNKVQVVMIRGLASR